MQKLSIIPIISLIFGLLAMFGIVLPSTVTQTSVVAIVMMALNVATAIARWDTNSAVGVEKYWYQSRIIVAQIIGFVFAALTMFGVAIGFEQQGLVDIAMILIAGYSWLRSRGPQAWIK